MNVKTTMETASISVKICMADIAVHADRVLFWMVTKELAQVRQILVL